MEFRYRFFVYKIQQLTSILRRMNPILMLSVYIRIHFNIIICS